MFKLTEIERGQLCHLALVDDSSMQNISLLLSIDAAEHRKSHGLHLPCILCLKRRSVIQCWKFHRVIVRSSAIVLHSLSQPGVSSADSGARSVKRQRGPLGNVSYLESVVHQCYVTEGSKRLDQWRISCLIAPT
jgi:hypothetical protein